MLRETTLEGEMNWWIYGNKRQIIECENAWW